MKFSIIIILFYTVFSDECFAQPVLRIEIISKPASHANDTLYIAGSFNNWNPAHSQFYFIRDNLGKEYIEIKGISTGIIEYKITRGSWNGTESGTSGSAIQNRILNFSNDTTLQVTIEGWADDFPSRPPASTKSKHVFILDTAFYIPQLNRTRRIWIYLPESYAYTKKRYPVLYMQDGQNLFDILTAPYGEWGVDEMMDTVKEARQSIVVGIDHGGNKRLTEYNPYNTKYGKGEGDAYVDFIVQSLKPYIDSVYRTKPSRANTLIAGSSMGGLISFYAVIKYPEVFGGAGVLSPSFWIAPQLKGFVNKLNFVNKPSVYFVCGLQESDKIVSDVDTLYQELWKAGMKKIFFKTVKEGRHNEHFWQTQMFDCYQWLLKNQIR